jgi:hypothetical protein
MHAEHRRGPRVLMRMIFSLMDADGDGSISLQEFQAAHERIFKGIDQNKDGRVTMEEMRNFNHDPQIIRGRTSSGPYLVWELLALATIAAGPKSP